jgi:PIN domain nuclease of toxin-antitoxin system
MIILDTHIWIWLVNGDSRLSESKRKTLLSNETQGLGVSIICCWELAKLVEVGRLTLNQPIKDWINQALQHPGVQLLSLTPEIVVDSTQLPGDFHKDPADQLIVATVRIHDVPLMSEDQKILSYSYVRLEEGK